MKNISFVIRKKIYKDCTYVVLLKDTVAIYDLPFPGDTIKCFNHVPEIFATCKPFLNVSISSKKIAVATLVV